MTVASRGEWRLTTLCGSRHTHAVVLPACARTRRRAALHAPLVAGAHATEARALLLLGMVTRLDGTSRSGSLQRHPLLNPETV
jgi:hypothetical protein